MAVSGPGTVVFLLALLNLKSKKLQRVHNSTARLIMGTKRGEHVTPVPYRHLHWLQDPTDDLITKLSIFKPLAI